MRVAGLALLGASLCVGAARAATVAEHYVGIISGASTTDTLGLFGPKGADLAGKPIVIWTRYRTADLAQMTQCQEGAYCRFYSSRNAGAAAAGVHNAISVEQKTMSYTPARYADVFVKNGGQHTMMTETDVLDGHSANGGTGSQVSVMFEKKVAFGATLSPDNEPVRGVQDFVNFFVAGNFGPSETLTFRIVRADR